MLIVFIPYRTIFPTYYSSPLKVPLFVFWSFPLLSPPNTDPPIKNCYLFPSQRDLSIPPSLSLVSSSSSNLSRSMDCASVIIDLMTNIHLWVNTYHIVFLTLGYLTYNGFMIFLVLSLSLQISWCCFVFNSWIIVHCVNVLHFVFHCPLRDI